MRPRNRGASPEQLVADPARHGRRRIEVQVGSSGAAKAFDPDGCRISNDYGGHALRHEPLESATAENLVTDPQGSFPSGSP